MTGIFKLWMRCVGLALPALALCIGANTRAADAEILYQEKLRAFPFQPIVPLAVGGKNYPFMLDTGTYGPIFDLSLRGLLGTVAQKGMLSSFGSMTEADFYPAPKMGIGRLKMPEWVAATHDCAVHRRLAGVDIRGIMGIKPLDDCSIWLDFDHETLKIVRQMGPPPDSMKSLDFIYPENGQIPRIELELEGHKLQFIPDTGFNGCMGLQHDVFAKLVADGVIEPAAIPGAEVLQGETEGRKVASGRFKRGTLLGLDLTTSEVHDSGSVNNLGMMFLVNFNSIFDYVGKKFYYERRQALPPLASDRMLGAIILFPEGRNTVYRLYRNRSPAREAGLMEGDHLVRLGPLTDAEMNAASLYDMCIHHFSEIMEVEVIRPGAEKSFITHLVMPQKQYAFPVQGIK